MTFTVAVIPARGGSKGLPGKNLQTVGGIPLVVRAIRACQSSSQINLVSVSTDDDEIALTSINAGAKVIRRPAYLSTDTATSESALLHAIAELASEGIQPTALALVQCTTPFIDSTDIDGTIELLRSFDCALTVAPSHRFIWKREPTGAGVGVNHKSEGRSMRQDLPPEFVETGGVYAMSVLGLVENKHRFFGRIGLYIVPTNRSMEIDDVNDLSVAQTLSARTLNQTRPPIEVLTGLRAVVFDFDGVMTNNKVIISESGDESVVCDRGDGLGIEILKDADLMMLILSKERNSVVRRRARKLNLEVIHGCDNKITALKKWLDKNSIDASECAYIGNDLNDVECLKFVGLAITPSDAHQSAKHFAHWILLASGGNGAVREFADAISDAHQIASMKKKE